MTEKIGKNRNVKIYLLLFALLAAVLFSSFGSSMNITERALVHAMGIDPGENGGFKVTMQVFKTSGAGSDTPVDVSQPNVEIIKGEGETISSAIEDARNQMGKDIFLGHLQLICFNTEIDFSNPDELFQFALKDKNIYLGVDLCLSETTAEEIMNAQMTRGTTSAEAMKQILEMNIKNSATIKCEIIDMISTINTPQNILIPVLSVQQEEQGGQSGGQEQGGQSGGQEQGGQSGGQEQGGQSGGQEQGGQSGGQEQGGQSGGQGQGSQPPQIVVTSTAIIKDGKVLDTRLDADQASGVAWLTRQAKQSSMVVSYKGELVNVRLTKDKSSVTIENRDGRVIYKTKLVLLAHTTKNMNTPDESAEMEKDVKRRMQEILNSAQQTAFYDSGADVFGVWRLLRHKYPQDYLKYKDDLQQIYSVTNFETELIIRVE